MLLFSQSVCLVQGAFERAEVIRALEVQTVTGAEQVDLTTRVTYTDPIWQMVLIEPDDHHLYANAPASDLIPGDEVRDKLAWSMCRSSRSKLIR